MYKINEKFMLLNSCSCAMFLSITGQCICQSHFCAFFFKFLVLNIVFEVRKVSAVQVLSSIPSCINYFDSDIFLTSLVVLAVNRGFLQCKYLSCID